MPAMEWNYWITYSGTVEAATEDEAISRADEDAQSRIPVVEVEPIEGGEGQ